MSVERWAARGLGRLVVAAMILLMVVGCTAARRAGPPTATIGEAPGDPAASPPPTGASMPPTGADGSGGPAPSAAALPFAGAGVDPRGLRLAGTVATGMTTPWGLAFLPDGSALVSQRDDGRILLVRPPAGGSGPDPAQSAVIDLGTAPGVRHSGEGGLLGLAVGPAFADDRLVYAYLTTASDNRIVRMELAPGAQTGALDPAASAWGPPQVLVSGIARGEIHNGGRLAFGPDGMLYASTGDASDRPDAQDPGSLNGKILRLSPDGAPAPGNPDPASPVYSLGHRNVQGLAFDADGRLWASEFGQDAWDELNLIVPGGNYGWPIVEGIAGDPRFRDPIAQWRTAVASPSGLAIIGDAAVLAGLRGERLWVVPLAGGAQAGDPIALLEGELGRLRTVALAPDGSVWVMTGNTDGRGRPRPQDDRIVRLTP